ncbi:MAG: DNA lyase [Ignavibacteriae bacterium HGW-Ignavibacteriae-4]|jgi:N-glycosylase/DNA lyase|nr:MAG: DNA lyase [Ignavibacteriae bacterium HGW-Ignavibacteriae-4]
MISIQLPIIFQNKYEKLKPFIRQRLDDFKNVQESKYFYELCFCICTPQSRASSAMAVQLELEKLEFLNKEFDPTPILRNKNNYIRFHNQKSKRLILIKKQWVEIKAILDSEMTGEEKREWINDNVNGIGRKESAHYLRNIGYTNLAILDRHILKHLVTSGVFKEVPNISTKSRYDDVSAKFMEFSNEVRIPMDELDLLFWAEEAGEILK